MWHSLLARQWRNKETQSQLLAPGLSLQLKSCVSHVFLVDMPGTMEQISYYILATTHLEIHLEDEVAVTQTQFAHQSPTVCQPWLSSAGIPSSGNLRISKCQFPSCWRDSQSLGIAGASCVFFPRWVCHSLLLCQETQGLKSQGDKSQEDWIWEIT